MSRAYDRLLDLLYPTRCVFCRGRIPPGRPGVCPTCQERIPHGVHTTVQYASDCVSACLYEDEVRAAVRRYKFGGAQSYAYAFSEWVAERIQEELWDRYDVLSWVPLSPDRRRSRGYDQSELLAVHTGRRLCRPAVPVLEKKRGVPQQSKTANTARRRANILGAYAVPVPERVRDRRILLIDDIVTSGATLSECAKTLLAAGAGGVVCATLAKAPRRRVK